MKDAFVKTRNVAAFTAALEAARAKRGPKLVLVKGNVGLGKTRTCAWYTAQNGAVYIEAQPGWNIGWFLDDMCFELGITPAHKLSNRSRQVKAFLAKERLDIIIDEADRLKHDRKVLETIQSVHDYCDVPVVLVGMGEIDEALRTYPQLTSRVYQKVEFSEITRAELPAIFHQLSEVEVPADAIDEEAAKNLRTMRAIEHIIPDVEKAVRSSGGKRADSAMVENAIKKRLKPRGAAA